MWLLMAIANPPIWAKSYQWHFTWIVLGMFLWPWHSGHNVYTLSLMYETLKKLNTCSLKNKYTQVLWFWLQKVIGWKRFQLADKLVPNWDRMPQVSLETSFVQNY